MMTIEQFRAQQAAEFKRLNDLAIAQHKADREAEIAQKQREWEARSEAKATEQMERDKIIARQTWITSGGAADDFEDEWPALHKELVKQRTLDTMGANEVARQRRDNPRYSF